MKLWGGRFEEGMDALMERFNASIGFDWKMWAADTEGSIAYAAALERSGLLTADERDTLQDGLRQIQAEFASLVISISASRMRISIRRSSGVWANWSGRSRANCTPVARATTRSPPTCACICAP